MTIMPEGLRAQLELLEPMFEEAEEAMLRGKVECAHLPGRVNRWCSGCGALIVAHELVVCARGHEQMVTPGTRGPIALWCTDCEAFRDFAV